MALPGEEITKNRIEDGVSSREWGEKRSNLLLIETVVTLASWTSLANFFVCQSVLCVCVKELVSGGLGMAGTKSQGSVFLCGILVGCVCVCVCVHAHEQKSILK